MPVNLLPNALSELFAQVSHTGYITLADRYGLMAAVLDDSLDEEQRMAIDRLIRAVYKRRLIVVNEISHICEL